MKYRAFIKISCIYQDISPFYTIWDIVRLYIWQIVGEIVEQYKLNLKITAWHLDIAELMGFIKNRQAHLGQAAK